MKNEIIKGYHLQIGSSTSNDPVRKDVHLYTLPGTTLNPDTVRFDWDTWYTITDELAKTDCNTLLIDVLEGVEYESHPEISAKNAISKEQCKKELDRLRGMGFEVIPKLNFSARHDAWMGMYGWMASTPTYYKVCADLIDEVSELFDKPRLFHLGMDEENVPNHIPLTLDIIRHGDLWWHDFLYLVKCVEKNGARPWIWADEVWFRQYEFIRRMPHDVLLSNWYYEDFDRYDRLPDRYLAYDLLDKYGYDQVPTGSSYVRDDNFELTVKYCKEHISKEHLLGFMQTSWLRTLPEKLDGHMKAIKAFNEGIKLI